MERREKILITTSWISVVGNAILSLSKILVGLLYGSLAVLGDGIDSATDVVISFITLFTAKIVSRPPNSKYVFGFEKAEGIASKVLSMIIFFAGLQMLITSGKGIFYSAEKAMPSMITIYITITSLVGKLLLAYYQFYQGKRVESSMLIANAKNMRNDVIISAGVLLGLAFTFVLKMPVLDSVTGLLISIYIIKSSVEIFMESNAELMDGVNDLSVYEKIFKSVETVPGACNPHRVRSRQIGTMYMIDLDIEVDGDITLNEAHKIAHAVEDSIKRNIENVYDIVVHVEPKGEFHKEEKFGLDKNMLSP